ncbi:metallophosphoesterase [Paenibacillus sp. KQZ6P-2]|uniref:Metallophosphoesterase n=1 Tax=Paenibacillus mangrovi TaxID=2931978 RepID=A0A9X2B7B2_9BACL|nr:metallophosphoesterase [Paenibacillus mangrovi]MCJ8013518.1 metallophosphoesterase [Paenibacillus mangrovi]
MTTQLERKLIEMFIDESRIATDKRPWFGQLPEGLTNDFSFAVMGDRCGMMTAGVFEKGLELLQDLRPDFVLFVGDLVEGYWKDAAKACEEWEYIDAKIAATSLPFFQTIGNHDYGTQAMVDVWRERKGMDYYAFRIGDSLFLTLNTEDPFDAMPDEFIDVVKRSTEKVHQEPERTMEYMKEFYDEIISLLTPEQQQGMNHVNVGISAQQLAFFEKVLTENADAKHTFVSMHKPGWKAESVEFARLEELLADRPYTVFAGHFHSLEYSQQDNRTYIQLGRTGAAAHGTGRADDNLILWVTVRSGSVSYRVMHLDGVTDVAAYPPHSHEQKEG